MIESEADIAIQIESVLEKCRPYLYEDGGDIEFVNYEIHNRTAVFRFLGNCSDCPLSIMTLRAGIERMIISEIPEIRRIEAIK